MDTTIDQDTRRKAEIWQSKDQEQPYHLGEDIYGLLDLQVSVLRADCNKNGTLRTFTRHTNPDGSRGGFVEDTAYVADKVFMDPMSVVFDTVKVGGAVERIERWVMLKGSQSFTDTKVIGAVKHRP